MCKDYTTVPRKDCNYKSHCSKDNKDIKDIKEWVHFLDPSVLDKGQSKEIRKSRAIQLYTIATRFQDE
jgi:ribosomal protein S25